MVVAPTPIPATDQTVPEMHAPHMCQSDQESMEPRRFILRVESVFYEYRRDIVSCAVLLKTTFELERNDVLGLCPGAIFNASRGLFRTHTDYAVAPFVAKCRIDHHPSMQTQPRINIRNHYPPMPEIINLKEFMPEQTIHAESPTWFQRYVFGATNYNDRSSSISLTPVLSCERDGVPNELQWLAGSISRRPGLAKDQNPGSMTTAETVHIFSIQIAPLF